MTRVRLPLAIPLCVFVLFGPGCSKKPTPATEPAQGSVIARRPVVGSEAEKEAKAIAVSRLKEIGIAIHKYHDAHKQFPAGIVGPDNQLGLSWRVQILPYIGEEELYKQFKLNEAWNSEENKKLLAKMPKVFETTGQGAEPGETYLRSITGPWAIMPQLHDSGMGGKKSQAPPEQKFAAGTPAPGRKITDITDGASNTIMVAEAADAVEWTKPEELVFVPFGGNINPPPLGGPFAGGFHGLMCDGAVHFIPLTLERKTIAAMITVNRGDILPKAATDILSPPKPKENGTEHK